MCILSKFGKVGLVIVLMLVFSVGNIQQECGLNVDLSIVLWVGIDCLKQIFMLYECDKWVYGLKLFQDLVDQVFVGLVFKLLLGIYVGLVVIDKLLIIEGGDQVIIDFGDKGMVMILNVSNFVLCGLYLIGFGDLYDIDDFCFDVWGYNNVIENIKVDNCLFGFDFK